MTQTEAKRRLRQSAQVAREFRNIPKHWRVEIGPRVCPVVSEQVPASAEEAWSSDPMDDLADILLLKHYSGDLRPGEVVHLYFYTPGDSGELEDVMTVWSGYGDEGPVLLEDNGRWILTKGGK